MALPNKRVFIALVIALYFYFLLPATAVLFYELYHLVKIDAVYWAYSAFKAASYYFGVYEHKLVVCLSVAALIIFLPPLFNKRGKPRGES